MEYDEEIETFIKKIIEQPLYSANPRLQFYSYLFPDGKIYIGYTSFDLNMAYKDDKFCEASPVCQYLNYFDIKPTPEGCIFSSNDDVILDKYKQILDKYNLSFSSLIQPPI